MAAGTFNRATFQLILSDVVGRGFVLQCKAYDPRSQQINNFLKISKNFRMFTIEHQQFRCEKKN